MTTVVILIPAAGTASRMRGEDKLLTCVDGEAQLARITRSALQTGCRVIVTLSENGSARQAVLSPHDRLTLEIVADASEGMSASLRAGAQAAREAEGMMVVPADMPELDTEDLDTVLDQFLADPSRPVRGATQTSEPGHPVILPKELVQKAECLSGDEGAKRLLLGEDTILVPLRGQRAILDLDTPEDWVQWLSDRAAFNPDQT